MQRYRCGGCKKTFSDSTLSLEFRQKKRHINRRLYELLVSSVTMRRSATLLKIDQKTVAHRVEYFAKVAGREHEAFLRNRPPSERVQFDDMETSEHTKLKPLSIPLVVDAKSREILSFDVAQMPAKGRIAAISRKKYGHRKDLRRDAWLHVLTQAKITCIAKVIITSDEHSRYPEMIRIAMPEAVHVRVKSRRACVVGQGEMKKGGNDPLFALNHSAAMHRANISVLVRRTWTTTKRPDRLKARLAMYAYWHNEVIAAKREGRKHLRFLF